MIKTMNLNDKTAVVFGGNGVIGSNLIQKFFFNNIGRVYATYHKKHDRIDNLKIRRADDLSFSQIDINSDTAVQKFVDNIDEINVGVNCVGITDDRSISKLSKKSWDNVIQTNLTGSFNISKSLFKKMKSQKKGRIINISSIVGYTGAFGQANYSASKSGIIGLTKTMAIEGAKDNILVNCVMPGYINSDMSKKIPKKVLDKIIQNIPLRKLGTPDDVTDLILFLSSDYSSYITGEVICVDGGL